MYFYIYMQHYNFVSIFLDAIYLAADCNMERSSYVTRMISARWAMTCMWGASCVWGPMHMHGDRKRHISGRWYIYALVSDKRVWLPTPIIKGVRPCRCCCCFVGKGGGRSRAHGRSAAQRGGRGAWCTGARVCVWVSPVLWWIRPRGSEEWSSLSLLESLWRPLAECSAGVASLVISSQLH